MSVSYEQYLHPDDKRAMNALKVMPGFALLTGSFIHAFEEVPAKMIAMSNYIRVTPQQYSELYWLLPPICKQLEIKEPELYVEMNRDPNAYTLGNRNAMIIVTSGLVESVGRNELRAALAHECGHIACHHVLYKTMAMYLFHQLDAFICFTYPVSTSIYLAMKHWMRCSELSADRAAAVCTGEHDEIRLLMNLSGSCGKYCEELNVDAYLNQVKQYQENLDHSVWSKLTNGVMLMNQDHPFMASRVLELDKWCGSEQFQNIMSEERGFV